MLKSQVAAATTEGLANVEVYRSVEAMLGTAFRAACRGYPPLRRNWHDRQSGVNLEATAAKYYFRDSWRLSLGL